MRAENMIGGNPKNERSQMDFYPTPPEVTRALLERLKYDLKGATIWEPACGDGRMANEMTKCGYKVIATDIITGTDFLDEKINVPCDWIITNPPFSMAEKFIRRAKNIGVPFAFLLKSQYWHAARRIKLFREIQPSEVLPLTWRPDFTGKGSSLLDVCWCVWGTSEPGVTEYEPLEKPKMESIQNENR